MKNIFSNVIRQWYGPLTDTLSRSFGQFGLGQVPADKVPEGTTSLVCGFCSTGCNLEAHLKEGVAVNITPTVSSPVNIGMACPKGWESLNVTKSLDRATVPLIRGNRKDAFTPTSWDDALQTFVERFKSIQTKYGPESLAFISTGQIPTEEMAFLGALSKFGMGIRHGDGNTRQCMATSVAAYKQAFGFDAPPYTYDDFEKSDCIILVGSNLCIAHPIMWQRILRNKNNPQIIVIDPRFTETAMNATQYIGLKPKSDLNLFYGIANILIRQGNIDEQFIRDHTSDFDAFAIHVETYSPERVSRDTGISVEQLYQIANAIAGAKRASFWWTMGVNQSYQGVLTAQAIINIALMTGNIGKPGTGANSITGQCNAMGSRLFSNTTNLLGGRDFKDQDARRHVANFLDIPEDNIPNEAGYAYHEIIEKILQGKIKGLWVIATNPAHSWINQNMCKDVLDRLDFLVVQDMYRTTETAELADMILPAAGWGEKDGTFINSERRIGLIKKVLRAPDQALSDFNIFKLIASYWGCEQMFEKWRSPADVFQLLKELSRDQPCDFTGIRDYQQLDVASGIQWPFPDKGPPQLDKQRRLFSDGAFFHSDRKAKFIFGSPRHMPELPTKRFPFILLTGRGSAAQWHTQTRTSKSATLRELYPQKNYVEMNTADASRLGIRNGDLVIVESQRGKLEANAVLSPALQSGNAFVPMHYSETNRLTLAHFDPVSKQPSFKDCAVQIRKPDYRDG